MEVEILKQVASGGSVVVCVALVIIFLKVINDMTDRFNKEHAETREAFQAQITALTGKVFEMAEKTTNALNEVKIAIIDLRNQIK